VATTIPGGGSFDTGNLSPSATQSVGNALQTLSSEGITSSMSFTSLPTSFSQDPTVVSIFTPTADFLNSVAASGGNLVLPSGSNVVLNLSSYTGSTPISVSFDPNSTNTVFVGGTGPETVNISGLNTMIIGGSGNDVYSIPAPSSTEHADSATTHASIITGNGNNEVYAGTGNNTIITGTGNNVVGLGSGNNLVYSQGNDTLIAGSGNQTIGAGAGTVNMFAGTGHSTLIGGSGNDQIFLQNGSGNVAAAGTGHTTIVGGTGSNILIGGNSSTSNTLIFGGTGNETIFGGAGHETMYGGGGSNLFAFTSGSSLGGGNNVIGDFNTATDHLGFLGYGTASQILSNATVVGGSTIISLSDGTKITLVGITKLTAGNIVTS
jgi:Ca2+-binding RTX toxin-like protein